MIGKARAEEQTQDRERRFPRMPAALPLRGDVAQREIQQFDGGLVLDAAKGAESAGLIVQMSRSLRCLHAVPEAAGPVVEFGRVLREPDVLPLHEARTAARRLWTWSRQRLARLGPRAYQTLNESFAVREVS